MVKIRHSGLLHQRQCDLDLTMARSFARAPWKSLSELQSEGMVCHRNVTGSGRDTEPMPSKEAGNIIARTLPRDSDALECGLLSTSCFPLSTLSEGRQSCKTRNLGFGL